MSDNLFDNLWNEISNAGLGVAHFQEIIKGLSSLFDSAGKNYIEGDTARNAIIDSIIQMLQAQKSK